MQRSFALAWTAIIGTAYFGAVILLLSLFETDYNPMTEVASLYGIGPYAIEMNLGFLLAGVGIIAFAWANAIQRTDWISRAGSILLVIDGLAFIMDSYFTTSPEGAPPTLHNLVHGSGGAIIFFTAPVALLLVYSRMGRGEFLVALSAFVIGVVFEVTNAILSLNLGGLAERYLIYFILGSVFAASLRISSARRLMKRESSRPS